METSQSKKCQEENATNGQLYVDLVLMGAHKVFRMRGETEPLAIINAVGADAVSRAAAEMNVPVIFVIGDEKIVTVDSIEQAQAAVSFGSECDVGWPFRQCEQKARIACKQIGYNFDIGYDFVRWRPNMKLLVGDMK